MDFKTDLQKTLLIPLWARNKEAEEIMPIIQDAWSGDIIRKLDVDLSYLDGAWQSQLAIVIRTKIINDKLSEFIQQNNHVNVISLGCGLDGYAKSFLKENVSWYDLDLPEVINIRSKFISEKENLSFIRASVLDFSWMNEIRDRTIPTLVFAEGLLFYLDKGDVINLIKELSISFDKVEILAELVGPGMVGLAKLNDSIKRLGTEGAEFKWSLINSEKMESWGERLKVCDEKIMGDFYPERWKHVRYYFKVPFIKRLFSNRIVHLKNYF